MARKGSNVRPHLAPYFRTMLSSDEEASLELSAENSPSRNARVTMLVPGFPCHSSTVLSADAEASLKPSGDERIELINP